MNTYEDKRINKFIQARNKLIDKLDLGLIEKKDFLFQNYLLVTRFGIKPFLQPDTVFKGLYNYQYYNIMAKYSQLFPDKRNSKESLDKINNYYREKDMAIIHILTNKEAGRIIAYPLILDSEKLNCQLFEIILLDYEKIVLHSLNKDIKRLLLGLACFETQPRQSLIHTYVNKSY